MIRPGTIGDYLAQAEANFLATGGYKATAHCGDNPRVDLIHQTPGGYETILSTAAMPEGIAPEDIASRLLADKIGQEAADQEYFVITLVN